MLQRTCAGAGNPCGRAVCAVRASPDPRAYSAAAGGYNCSTVPRAFTAAAGVASAFADSDADSGADGCAGDLG